MKGRQQRIRQGGRIHTAAGYVTSYMSLQTAKLVKVRALIRDRECQGMTSLKSQVADAGNALAAKKLQRTLAGATAENVFAEHIQPLLCLPRGSFIWPSYRDTDDDFKNSPLLARSTIAMSLEDA